MAGRFHAAVPALVLLYAVVLLMLTGGPTKANANKSPSYAYPAKGTCTNCTRPNPSCPGQSCDVGPQNSCGALAYAG